MGGQGWTLRGNGALVVPLAGGPALLSAGWAGLTLWGRGNRRWSTGVAIAGTAALLLGLAAAFLPVLVGGGAQLLVSVLIAGVVFGLGICARFGRPSRRAVLGAALVVLLLVLAATDFASAIFVIQPLLLAMLVMLLLWLSWPGSDPQRLRRRRWMLLVGSLALPVALVAGFYLSQAAVSVLGPPRSVEPVGHTATLLTDGRVLVTGANGP